MRQFVRPWVIFLAGPLPLAWGQSPAPATASGVSVALQEVVVTAQRRRQNLQDVPISVTAVSNAALEAAGVSNTEGLGMAVAGLSIQETSGAFQPHIRGVGTSANGPGVESPVATYVDGVYYANASSAILSLNDVDRVEVLKGPQGTLFGRNTTGGLIQIVTKDPQQAFSGSDQITYGNYGDVVDNLYVTGGLSGSIASSLSVHYEHQGEGYGTNLFNGEPVDRMSYDYAVRNKYLFEPADATQIRLTLDYERRLSNFLTQHPLDEGQAGAANALVFDNAAFGGPFDYGSARDTNVDLQPRAYVQNGGVALNAKRDLGVLTFTSITAYRDSAFGYDLDIDYTPVDATSLVLFQRDSQFSQELQLASGNSTRLTWVAGLYYFWAKDSWDPLGILLRGPSAAPLPAIDVDYQDSQQTDSYAAYAQATEEILRDTDVTLGARYTYEVKNFGGLETTTFPGLPIPATVVPAIGAYPGHLPEDRPSYRIAVDHKFTPQAMIYVSYTTGFKSGGFNVNAPSEDPYKPETVDAWEAGVKTEWLDDTVRANVSAFHYDYSNIQIGYFIFGSEAFRNGAKAEIYGTDLDLEAVLTPGLTLTGGLEWMHDQFLSFPDAPVAIPGVACTTTTDAPMCQGSVAGNKLPYSPDASFDIGAHYGRRFGGGKLDFDLRYLYDGGWFGSPDNTLYQPSFHLLNASLLWTDPSGRWSAGVWGKNLTNALYAVSMLEAPQGDARTLGAPRTYGATVTYHFGS
ncbi:MAG TPA: TonB-dependent receptor [Steroidobacteraceae bacterium]|nr:TonB-dependent receptor [Steroidobacteraceae bacterium]